MRKPVEHEALVVELVMRAHEAPRVRADAVAFHAGLCVVARCHLADLLCICQLKQSWQQNAHREDSGMRRFCPKTHLGGNAACHGLLVTRRCVDDLMLDAQLLADVNRALGADTRGIAVVKKKRDAHDIMGITLQDGGGDS